MVLEVTLSSSQRCLGHGAMDQPGWGAGGDVLSTQVLPLKCKAGRLLAMIHHQSQKADILSQGQSWIPAHVDESLRLPQTSLLESVFKKSCFSS